MTDSIMWGEQVMTYSIMWGEQVMTEGIMWGDQVLNKDYSQINIDLLNTVVMEVYSMGAILWIRCAINT